MKIVFEEVYGHTGGGQSRLWRLRARLRRMQVRAGWTCSKKYQQETLFSLPPASAHIPVISRACCYLSLKPDLPNLLFPLLKFSCGVVKSPFEKQNWPL